MGNCCFTSTAPCATLFDARGGFLRRLQLPLTAAELMLEAEAGHVVSLALELQRTGKFAAMKADEELSSGSAYVLVPVAKLNRKVPEGDVTDIMRSVLAKRRRKTTRSGGSRVSPAAALEKGFEGIRVSDNVGDDLGFVCRQRDYSRGWKPDLETITETSKFIFKFCVQ